MVFIYAPGLVLICRMFLISISLSGAKILNYSEAPYKKSKTARLLVSGCDVWVNTPRRPLEASGTSGMKATINGVPHFSVLDGWWIEGYAQNPLSGFTIGPNDDTVETSSSDSEDANDLYNKLQNEIIPMYYDKRGEWIERMKNAITLGATFNTHRCVQELLQKAWKN